MGGATDGCIPQTREHLTITKQLGLKHLVVSINMCDAADVEMMEATELLEEMGFSEGKLKVEMIAYNKTAIQEQGDWHRDVLTCLTTSDQTE